MRIIIPLWFASFVLVSCGNNQTKTDAQQTSSSQEGEVVCQIHDKNCHKIAIEMDMNIDEYHKWQDEQLKSIKDEDEMTNANGDIVDPNQPTQNVYTCEWCGGEYDNKGFLADKYGKVEEIRERQMEGIRIRKEKGLYSGRRIGTTDTPERLLQKEKSKLILKYIDKGYPVREIEKIVSCSKTTITKVRKAKAELEGTPII